MPKRLVPNSDERTNLSPEERRQARERSYRLLREILRPHRLSLAISVAAVILGAIASAVQPWLIARVLDTAIEPLTRGDSAPLIFFVVLFGATVLANGTLTWVNVVYTVRVSLGVLLSLRTRVFQHSQSLSVSFHESYTSGRVISRLTSDIDTIRTFLDSGISQLATTLLGIAFSVIAIFLLDWRIGLLLVAMTVPIWLITHWFRTRSETAFRAMRNESAQLTSRFVETYTGIRAIKGFGAEADARALYARNAERYRVAVMDSIKLFGIYSPVLILLGNIFVAAALVIGGYAVLGGTMQVGTLLALIIYANRVFEPIMTLSEFYNLFQSAFSALEKISGFLAERPQVREAEHPVQRQVLEGAARGAVEFQNAQFAYVEGTPALQRTSLSVPAGQRVALVGATGAGKSTIAKLLSRFYDVSDGRVLLDGVDIRRLSDAQLRQEVVMLTQEVFLFSDTIAGNIRLGNPNATDEQVVAAAQAVGAHEFISALPQGYQTMLGRAGTNLSAGQRQLVSFARVFLADPNVVILDEATASLDIPSERAVQRALNTLLSGRTAFIIAHRLSTVLAADRVLVIDAGEVVEDGSPQALTAAGGQFATMRASWDELNNEQ